MQDNSESQNWKLNSDDELSGVKVQAIGLAWC